MNSETIERPTVLSSYGLAWRQYKKHFLYVFLVGLIVAVALSPTGTANGGPGDEPVSPMLQLVVAAYGFLILPVVRYGADWLFLRFLRDERPAVAELFDGFRRDYLNIVLANLMVFAIVALGFVLLIVPGVVFACRLAFVPYLVMDKRLEPVAAVEKSWDMTRGYGFSIFGLFLLAIPIGFVGLLLLGVGLFFALIWVSLAFAAMYHGVDSVDRRRLDENGAGT